MTVHITNLSVSGSVGDAKYLIDAELGDLSIIDSRETSKHKKCVYYVILHHFFCGDAYVHPAKGTGL